MNGEKTMTNKITPEIVERALLAHMVEKSAQVGERFDREMFEVLRSDNPEAFDEEVVQMRCALEAVLSMLRPQGWITLRNIDRNHLVVELDGVELFTEFFESGECEVFHSFNLAHAPKPPTAEPLSGGEG